MAFSLWIIGDRTRVIVALLLLLSLLSSLSSALSIKCGKCEESRCPELHYCEGEAVKDHCGCCTVCSSSRYQPHPLIAASTEREGGACQHVDCPKFKVCMENVQGLPLCTCPSAYICRSRKRSKAVCGTNGITYESRCYMRIEACNSATRIKVAKKGPCGEEGELSADSMARARQCDSYSRCKRRKNQKFVCGTDGKTYLSRCHLKITACQNGVKIRVKSKGTCEELNGSPGVPYNPNLGGPVHISVDPDTGLAGHFPSTGVTVNDAAAAFPSSSSNAEMKKLTREERREERRKRRRNRGKNNHDDDDEDEDDKERRKQRREKRKKRKERRRKRRKTKSTRAKRRSRRFHRTFDHFAGWEY